MSEKHNIIPVWFFVGLVLALYGVLIFISGLAEWSHPPADVHLSNLHAPVWWGAILTVLGSAYLIKFRPGRNV